jgi:hypothetical protein
MPIVQIIIKHYTLHSLLISFFNMTELAFELNCLKYIIFWLNIAGLASYSFGAILKNAPTKSIYPKKNLLYCMLLSIIFTLLAYIGLQNCPSQYATILSKITTTLQRYSSLTLIFSTYIFNIIFRKKIVKTIKILCEVDIIFNSKSVETVPIKQKGIAVYIFTTLILVGTMSLNLIYELIGDLHINCGIQYHISNTVHSSTTCFVVLILMETTRRFTALNKHLTIVLKHSWDDFSTTYTDLVQISEIHCNLCEAAILINRYFEVQMLTAFSVSFYYFISIFFYFFTGFNIVSQYRTFFYVVNALIFRMLFLLFLMVLSLYAFRNTLNEVGCSDN